LRAWWANAPSSIAGSLRARLAELEAIIAQNADDRARTAERLRILEQQCAAALHGTAPKPASDVPQTHVRLENDATASGERHPAETVQIEHEAPWREERAAMEEARRQAEERSAELQAALARQQEEAAARECREATLRADLEAVRTQAHDDREQTRTDELERARTALAEAEAALQATRSELGRTTDQVVALSKTQDEITADRSRMAAELAVARAELASGTEVARHESQAADAAKTERETQWREERDALAATCRQAQERSAELEAALARQQENTAAQERREATLRADLDAARIRAHEDPEQMLADAELDRVRTALAEAETTLQDTRTELARATEQFTSLSQTHDQTTADRHRVAADLALAEERVAELERRLEELIHGPTPSERPVPF
jgi:hypothetical protein